MKLITALFEARQFNANEQNIPESRMERLRQSYRRRMSDALEEVFHRACVEADLRTATCLFAVLQDLHHRRRSTYGGERRFAEDAIAKAELELERCRTSVLEKAA